MAIIPPFTELLMNEGTFHGDEKALERIKSAKDIESYYQSPKPAVCRDAYYRALVHILEKQPRIALYIPLNDLNGAPEFFNIAYRLAWSKLCFSYDPRIDYGQNDPSKTTTVVKSLHLVPWLIKYGIMSEDMLLDYARETSNSETHVFTFREISSMIRPLISEDAYKTLDRIAFATPLTALKAAAEVQPGQAYGMENIKEHPKAIALSNPTGPFSNNLNKITGNYSLENLKPGEILLLGGPSLYGYAGTDPEIIIDKLDLSNGIIKSPQTLKRCAPELAHLYLNTAWADNTSSSEDLQWLRAKIVAPYLEPDRLEDREVALRSMERGLIQGDLIRFGMKRAYPEDLSEKTKKLSSIDGDSAFWDDRYRRIATTLFAKYVWLP